MTLTAARTAPDLQEDPATADWLPCVLYLRLSDARNEKGSFDDRERALRAKAASRRWRVVGVVIENDVIGGTVRAKSASAFKRRRVTLPDGRVKMRVYRPGFRSILDDLTAGRARAVIAEDLDRTMRDPRDLEDLIDVIGAVKGSADSLSGSLKFTDGGTDSELTMARVMVAMANKSSLDTSRRVRAGRERRAASGGFGGGRRPYGFEADGVTVVDFEADVIRAAAGSVLSGVPLRFVARNLQDENVPAARGTRWTSATLRAILLRPRNAGRLVHRGEDIGPAPWAPILEYDRWQAVVGKLTDPERTFTVGPASRRLGTGIYRCVCGAPVGALCSKKKAPAYRCDRTERGDGGAHVARNGANVDALVVDAVVELMCQPAAADVFDDPASGIDANALRAEVRLLNGRKDTLALSLAEGEINRAQLAAGTKRIDAKLRPIEQLLAAQTDVSPAEPLAKAARNAGPDMERRAADVRRAWDALPLGAQRAIVSNLLVVTILPVTTMGRRFDADSVRIERVGRSDSKKV